MESYRRVTGGGRKKERRIKSLGNLRKLLDIAINQFSGCRIRRKEMNQLSDLGNNSPVLIKFAERWEGGAEKKEVFIDLSIN